jgi:nitroreductase
MLTLIRNRRSIRKFTPKEVEDEKLQQVIEAGIWAPSGLNNQPWKFAVIKDPATQNSLASLTRYAPIIEGAPVIIAVFLDESVSYDRTKDIQAIGACIQNMLLALHSLGLGGVWLGEILKNKEKVSQILGAPDTLEFMALVALGYPAEEGRKGIRKDIEELVFLRK